LSRPKPTRVAVPIEEEEEETQTFIMEDNQRSREERCLTVI